MPKKTKIKRDEIVSDAGLVLDAEQAAMVRKQMYEGSYSLDAPDITVDDDDITVRVGATVYTVYGDSPLHTTYTTSEFRRSGSVYVRGPHASDVESTVRNAIERARDAAEAAIKAVDEEWEANVGGPDDAEGDDADEGLREGPVVGSGPPAEFGSRADVEAVPSLSELKRRKAFAEAVIAECKAAEVSGSDDDWIRIPNGEYADLVAAARREAAFRDAFGNGLVAASSGGDGEMPCLRVDFPTFKVALRAHEMLLCGLDNHAFERPVPDDGEAPAGEIDIPEFVAATTGTETASDTSDAALDDGGPVEPELDIDALVAAADVQRDTCSLDIRAVRSAEYPHLTVTVTGPGSAELVGRIISDIHLPSLTEPLVVTRPVEGDVGEFAKTTVDIHVGDNVATLTAERRAAADLRKALAGAQRAGGLR